MVQPDQGCLLNAAEKPDFPEEIRPMKIRLFCFNRIPGKKVRPGQFIAAFIEICEKILIFSCPEFVFPEYLERYGYREFPGFCLFSYGDQIFPQC